MPRWITTLPLLSLALAGPAFAAELATERALPGGSWMSASDTLGEMIWPQGRDAVGRLGNVRQVRPSANRVHLTEGSIESLADWLEQFGEIETGPGPKR